MFTRSLQGTALAAIAFATAAHGQLALPVPVVSAPKASAVVAPYYGNIDPFYGNIDAFWKDINPFYGNIDPFWKDINPFYGNIDPFYGNIDPFYGNIDPFWGNIDPFYGNIDPFAGATPAYDDIGDFWKGMGPIWYNANSEWGAIGSYSTDPEKYQNLKNTLDDMVRRSEATWGAAVTARTGQSFRAGFADAVFARYGVNLDNLASFEGLTAAQRAHFFLDWYDGLMTYSGRDHLDYWMGTVNWTPALTKTQGGGARTVIGLLDSSVVNDADLANNIIYTGGYHNPLAGHGTGVASLMVAAHDGRGLMGIAPNATVAAYNPFDATGTASWADVTAGVLALSAQRASVINMSLGVPGWSLHKDWSLVFGNAAVAAATANTVFVIAAGNEGKAQVTNIPWNWLTDPNLIVVGSVDPSGKISSFSNTPGTACLLNLLSCSEANRLWNRFIVAPGEAILVSDGNGGLVRRSGTSFAAPLVSGAIALLHDRWPWLAKHPDESVDIILRSAKDLGSAGPDQVYGWGLLDVKASQSPLNFNNLVFYEYKNGALYPRTATSIRANGVKSNWEADGIFFALFENIGDTRRDFVVPLSSRLIGHKVSINGGSAEYFQSYLTSRFIDWIKTGKLTSSTGISGFSDVPTAAMAPIGDLELSFSATPSFAYAGNGSYDRAPHSMIRFNDRGRGVAITAGFGQGALAFNGGRGFGLTSDHRSDDGGVNPLLGFASGGAFAAVDLKLAPRWTLTGGLTSNRLVHSRLPGLAEEDRLALIDVDPYRARAFTLAVSHDVGSWLNIGASYTRLDEAAAVLGVQSLEPGDLGSGSVSDAATLSAHASLGAGIQLSLSATAANTRTSDKQAFTTGDGGVLSSAFAVAAAKTGIVGGRDQLRLSLAQPLHIERGPMEFTSVEVIDRSTGEIGPVTQRFDIGGQERRFIGEMLYATPLLDEGSELSLFGRAQLRAGQSAGIDNYVVGGRVKFAF